MLRIVCVLLFFVVLSAGITAVAIEADEVARTGNVFYVNGVRMPFRAFNVAGQDYINIFEVAISLSNTDARFSPRWKVRNYSLSIVSGRAFPFVGVNLPTITPTDNTAALVNVGVIFDNQRVDLTAYRVGNSVYFNLRQVAALLDVDIEHSATDNTVQLTADLTYTQSLCEERNIDPSKPMIALTFDDGPSQHTIPILDALERYEAVATFYVTANRLEAHMDIAKRMHNMGNEIANHSWSHPRLPDLSTDRIRAQLHDSNVAIAEITGMAPASLRPPFGAYDQRVIEISRELDLPLVLWSLDTRDWYTRNADAIFNVVMRRVQDRDIILLHDIHAPTARASVRLIPALIERGFQLVTVSELFYHSGITPQPGEIYNCGHGE